MAGYFIGNYYIVHRMTGAEMAGPFTRYVVAFNVARELGAAAMVIEREVV